MTSSSVLASSGTTDSMNMSLSKLCEIVKEKEAWLAAFHGVAKSQTRLSNWTTTCGKIQWNLQKKSLKLNLARVQDTISLYKSQLYFYIISTNRKLCFYIKSISIIGNNKFKTIPFTIAPKFQILSGEMTKDV